MKKAKTKAIVCAIAAALFYALNMPFSKLLLKQVPAAVMAGLLYLGAGIGIGILFMFQLNKDNSQDLLNRSDLPYVTGMVVLDILAPISLMYGLSSTSAANASLLNNFEIAATAVIAAILFKEQISKRLWAAIFLVTVSSMLLSFEDLSSFQFSWGSLFVLLAAVFWGFENNCTRSISNKNTYQIVTIKGLCSGIGSLIIGFFAGEQLPDLSLIPAVLFLGFVAYGLSIFLYVRAQKDLGAAKTSAYYAAAPFAGALLSFLLLHETLCPQYFAALLMMLGGSAAVTLDTFRTDSTERTRGQKEPGAGEQ
ncbi:MAG: DMT family transporter [Ileibacterium sp.]|nr:DMT family transporter [Ileibacterium sp.]